MRVLFLGLAFAPACLGGGNWSSVNAALQGFQLEVPLNTADRITITGGSARFLSNLTCQDFQVGDVSIGSSRTVGSDEADIELKASGLYLKCNTRLETKITIFTEVSNVEVTSKSPGLVIAPILNVKGDNSFRQGPTSAGPKQDLSCENKVQLDNLDIKFKGSIIGGVLNILSNELKKQFGASLCAQLDNATSAIATLVVDNPITQAAANVKSIPSFLDQVTNGEKSAQVPENVTLVDQEILDNAYRTLQSVVEGVQQTLQVVDSIRSLDLETLFSLLQGVTAVNLPLIGNVTVPEALSKLTIDELGKLTLADYLVLGGAGSNSTKYLSASGRGITLTDLFNLSSKLGSDDPVVQAQAATQILDLVDPEPLGLGNGTFSEAINKLLNNAGIQNFDLVLLFNLPRAGNSTGGTGAEADTIGLVEALLSSLLGSQVSLQGNATTIDIVAIGRSLFNLTNDNFTLAVPLDGLGSAEVELSRLALSFHLNLSSAVLELLGEHTIGLPKLDLGDMQIDVGGKLAADVAVDLANSGTPVNISVVDNLGASVKWDEVSSRQAVLLGMDENLARSYDAGLLEGGNASLVGSCALSTLYLNVTAASLESERVALEIQPLNNGLLNLLPELVDAFLPLYSSLAPTAMDHLVYNLLTRITVVPRVQEGCLPKPASEEKPLVPDDKGPGPAAADFPIIPVAAAVGAALLLAGAVMLVLRRRDALSSQGVESKQDSEAKLSVLPEATA